VETGGRRAAAAELFHILDRSETERPVQATGSRREDDSIQNRTRQFLMKVANRIFTERPLSQVEVVAHLLGYKMEFTTNDAWTFLNVSSLYWHVFRRWRHLRCAGGEECLDETGEETVLLEEAGQRISFPQAYPHRGRFLQGLSLYDYMSVVKLKRKGKAAARRGDVEFDSTWPLSQKWVQTLRDPGKHATVCLDGYLCMDFREDDQTYYKRYVITMNIWFRTETYAKVAEKINSVDIGQPYNILPSSFRGNRSCQTHRAISMLFGRGKSRPCLGGYCFS